MKSAQFAIWRDAGGRIVRIANVNQARFRRIEHFRQIMLKAAGQRSFDDLGAIGAGVIENCFKGRICCYQLPVLRSGERFCTEF